MASLTSLNTAQAQTLPKNLTACPIDASYTATARSAGWLPTDEASAWVATAGTINRRYSTAVATTSTYSGSVSITMSGVVASANTTFGISLSESITSTQSWGYSLNVPSGVQARALLLHQADKITFTKYQNNANCTTTTTTGLIAYIPVSSGISSTYCWILDVYPAKTNWTNTCRD